MIIYFADKQMNIVSVASSNTKQGLILANDDKVEDVDTGAVTFEFDLYFTEKKQCNVLRFKVFPKRLGRVINVTLSLFSHHSLIKAVLSI